ncbi:unnamed protein product [Macrosiphum euphorbiae]|uniref:Uncharacterized protein n=1 Tax=Macrosiphum euphorbiae TaxID=13131 RepID=A0AAV0X9C8_9HEMI|nr:unnamed protein product [Macrosiphum euphorbiae]
MCATTTDSGRAVRCRHHHGTAAGYTVSLCRKSTIIHNIICSLKTTRHHTGIRKRHMETGKCGYICKTCLG